MKPGQGRLAWWLRWSVLLTGLMAGCAGLRPGVEEKLMADKGANNRSEGVLENYTLACPDVLEVTLGPQPAVVAALAPDGRVDLGALGQPRLEGLTPPQAARRLAEQASGLAPGQVQVRIAEFRSQHLFLFGEIHGLQRAVPYQGQETILDLLQRVGGITAGAAPEDVYVIRTRIAEGQRPEVFHVDLRHRPETRSADQPALAAVRSDSRRRDTAVAGAEVSAAVVAADLPVLQRHPHRDGRPSPRSSPAFLTRGQPLLQAVPSRRIPRPQRSPAGADESYEENDGWFCWPT